MQPECEDYYDFSEYGEGCCLKCPNSVGGCLCYNCKCKKCYWYIPPEEWNLENGKCGKGNRLNFNKWSEKFKQEREKKYGKKINRELGEFESGGD